MGKVSSKRDRWIFPSSSLTNHTLLIILQFPASSSVVRITIDRCHDQLQQAIQDLNTNKRIHVFANLMYEAIYMHNNHADINSLYSRLRYSSVNAKWYSMS